jgi:hypothetical protein
MTMVLRLGALFTIGCAGCTLTARQFLPRTGAYAISALECDVDGGQRVVGVNREMIVTDQGAGVSASVELPAVSSDASENHQDVNPRAATDVSPARGKAILLVDETTGNLTDGDLASPWVLLPNEVAIGKTWQSELGSDGMCAVTGRVDSVVGDIVRVAYELVCAGARASFVNKIWRVNRGWVETSGADGGWTVTVVPVPLSTLVGR